MSTPPAKPPLRKAPLFTPDVIVWSMLGMLGLGYLGVALFSPDMLRDFATQTSSTDSSQNIRTVGGLVSDVASLRDGVAQIQLDIAKLRTDVTGQSEQSKALEMQVSALEQRIKAQETPVEAKAAPAPTDPAGQTSPHTSTANVAPTAPQPSATSLDVPKTKVINAEKLADPTTLVTGSVKPKDQQAAEVSFGPAIVKPAPKPLGLKLSSGASVDSLRLSWSLLADRHGDALRNLEARYVAGGDAANPNYDLIAGPVKSKAEAIKICKDLAAKSVPCKVADFKGDAL